MRWSLPMKRCMRNERFNLTESATFKVNLDDSERLTFNPDESSIKNIDDVDNLTFNPEESTPVK